MSSTHPYHFGFLWPWKCSDNYYLDPFSRSHESFWEKKYDFVHLSLQKCWAQQQFLSHCICLEICDMDCFVDKVECVFLHILTKLSVGLFTYAEIAYFKFPCISKFYQHARMFLHCWCKLISCYIQLYMCIYIVMCPVKKEKDVHFVTDRKK